MDHKRYLVILADRVKGRFFTTFLGDFEEEEEVKDKVTLGKIKAVGGRNNQADRYLRDHLRKHLKLIGLKALEFVRQKKIDGVIIGGHQELIHKIKDSLPTKLKQKVMGEFVADLNLSLSELTQKSQQAI